MASSQSQMRTSAEGYFSSSTFSLDLISNMIQNVFVLVIPQSCLTQRSSPFDKPQLGFYPHADAQNQPENVLVMCHQGTTKICSAMNTMSREIGTKVGFTRRYHCTSNPPIGMSILSGKTYDSYGDCEIICTSTC